MCLSTKQLVWFPLRTVVETKHTRWCKRNAGEIRDVEAASGGGPVTIKDIFPSSYSNGRLATKARREWGSKPPRPSYAVKDECGMSVLRCWYLFHFTHVVYKWLDCTGGAALMSLMPSKYHANYMRLQDYGGTSDPTGTTMDDLIRRGVQSGFRVTELKEKPTAIAMFAGDDDLLIQVKYMQNDAAPRYWLNDPEHRHWISFKAAAKELYLGVARDSITNKLESWYFPLESRNCDVAMPSDAAWVFGKNGIFLHVCNVMTVVPFVL